MPTRTIRARVHGQHLEPLEDLALPDGSEVTLIVDIPAGVPAAIEASPAKLAVWDLGAPPGLTRKDYYAVDGK